MSRILAVAHNTFRQTVRERLFFNIFIFGAFMLLLGMVVANITFGHGDRVVRSIGLTGITLALDLIGLLIGVSLIHQEIDKKTLFVVLTRPIRRWEYTVGRYLGLLLSLATALAGLVVMYIPTLMFVGGDPSAADVLAFGSSWLEAGIIAGFGVMLSAFSTPTLSAGMGIGMWIAAATTDDLVRLTANAGGPPHTMAKVVNYILPSLSRLNFRDAVIYSQSIDLTAYAWAMLYGGVYCVLLVAIASIILSRREMV